MAVRRPRRPKGTPSGGQFAPTPRPEAEIVLFDDDAADRRQQRLETRLGQTMDDISCLLALGATIVDRGEQAFYADPVLQAAAKSAIIDLHSAFEHLPERVRQEHPNVPWHQVRGMRDLIAHEYDVVDFEVVWSVLSVELPVLRASLFA